ncbi:Ribosomal protein S18 acetylase RimI [Ruminococcus sp. YE71]|uniref:GNAT family N-acetyltransferase n=1 Tax=unclassified Ruminococcus TaxID=2608920 RepID=UPI00088A9286|nr:MULTISPECIES: N-acetyltransferase [unclassified Ruminococcus]SDA24292.1 Ribosomal protein S18 acetylase RimI [Ruminococcus sp. YE78]SFW41776.1 Ribosomal protein S18 acetylase RimI [Ruminococcus sp. YE71]
MANAADEVLISQASLDDIRELHEIEKHAFSAEKAATFEAFEYRITNFPQWFFKAESNGKIVGLIDGSSSDQPYITDKLYENGGGYDDSGENLLIYGLAVAPESRGNGIAHKLMSHLLTEAKKAGKKHVSLTCKESLIGFYEGMGYSNHGLSESVLGDVVSYDMELYL